MYLLGGDVQLEMALHLSHRVTNHGACACTATDYQHLHTQTFKPTHSCAVGWQMTTGCEYYRHAVITNVKLQFSLSQRPNFHHPTNYLRLTYNPMNC